MDLVIRFSFRNIVVLKFNLFLLTNKKEEVEVAPVLEQDLLVQEELPHQEYVKHSRSIGIN